MAVSKCLEQELLLPGNTILSILLRSTDPETGQKLSFEELVSNANTLLYESSKLS